MSLEVQFWTLTMMLLSGIGMGAVFDGYRVVSNQLRIGRLWIPVLDLLYWVAATLTVFRVLSASNEGELRIFVFIGLLFGVGCYFWLFSRIVISMVEWLIAAISAVIRFLLRCFDLLLVRPILLLYRLARIFLGFLIVLSMFLLRIVIQLIRPFWLFFRWMLSPVFRRLSAWIVPWMRQWRVPEWVSQTKDSIRRLWNKWF